MNKQNLKPMPERTETEQREITRKGGIASGKARKEKAVISAMYARFLAKKTKVLIDGKPATGEQLIEQVVAQLFAKGSDAAKVALMKEMREALEGSKVQVSGALAGIDIPYNSLTDKQKAAVCAANEALAEAAE